MIYKIIDFGTIEKEAMRLRRGAARAVNTEAPLAIITADMLRVTRINFDSSGRRGGGSWKKPSEAWAKRKTTNRILRETDELMDSVTELGAAHQILRVANTAIEFGTNIEYGAVHQEGSRKKNIPRRPFLRFIPSDYGRWNRILLDHLMRPHRKIV